jgi:hypothetical protein
MEKSMTLAFGEKTKSTCGKITDRVKSFEDACRELGIDPAGVLVLTSNVKEVQENFKAIAAFTKLTIIAKALNQGWTPDWSNSSQYKYYPWFEWKSGFGFSSAFYGCWGTYTFVGSRLCFNSEELAKYAGTQFEDIYQDFLTL